ncbi:MAG: hypothetical protein AAGJ86_06515 [Pseudomonadota bacterium]
MLLRRITKHVKQQDWFAVWVDFVIVVIGVFIGIQVANWNEAQKSRQAVQAYKKQLITDMELSIARNQFQVTQGRQEVEQLDFVLTALTRCELSESDKPVFAAGLYNMGKYDLPIMVTSTIDELKATGNFPLIGDSELRRKISETVREYQTKLAINPQLAGRTIPSVNYVRTRVRFLLDEHRPRLPEIQASKAVYDFEALCTDPTFLNAVTTVREMTLAIIGLNGQMAEFQQALLTDLLQE